jgi:DNA-binding MarR family transcriptional regulator
MVSFCDLKQLYRSINFIEQKIVQNHGLVINEAMILCLLKDKKLSSGDISEHIGLPSPHASKLLKMLETKGYITRSLGTNDKRKMFFALTDAGMQKLSEIGYLSQELCDEIKQSLKNLSIHE